MALAASAIAILAPYAKKAGDELVKTVGQIGYDKAKSLFAWLQQRFASDPAASKDLSRFQTNPEAFEPGLKATIAEKLQDPGFAEGLEKHIAEFGPLITVFQQIKEGKGVTAVKAAQIIAGVSATQVIEKGENITGVEAVVIGSGIRKTPQA
jgi:hypothetical protein